MSVESTPTGKLALRVSVRTIEGATEASLDLGEGQSLLLASIPAAAHAGCEDVRRKFIELAGAISLLLVKETLGGNPTLYSMHNLSEGPAPGQKVN